MATTRAGTSSCRSAGTPGARCISRWGRRAGWSPARSRAEVARWSDGAPLRPVARLETRRTVRRLVGESGEVLAEVADDQVTGSRPDPADPESWRLQDTWREVEVELKSGSPDLLDEAAAALAAAGATPSRSASKLARVLYGEPS